MPILIEGGSLFTPEEEIGNGAILVEHGKISAVGPRQALSVPEETEFLKFPGCSILPGLIDLHLHGLRGFDVSGEGLSQVISALPEYGVTSFLPTTYARPRKEIVRALEIMVSILSAAPPGAQPLGIHMEGPWLSPAQPGMADPRHFYPLTQEDIATFQKIAGGQIRMVTFAPEEGQALLVIPWLVQNGIIPTAGHTDADYETIRQAAALGLNHATHTFNAMRGLHHREPGALGAILDSNEIVGQLIGDGQHVHPTVMRLMIRIKGADRIALVSDATPPAGSPPGVYTWLGYNLHHDGQTSRLENGTLAGSVMPLNDMLRVLVDEARITFSTALKMATIVPARLLEVNKGELKPGRDADVTVFNDNYQAVLTMVEGKIVFSK
jgi:N-acetylglucosamine-6-phosphate deacetylase